MKKIVFIVALASIFAGFIHAENIPQAKKYIREAQSAANTKHLNYLIYVIEDALLDAPIFGNTKKFLSNARNLVQQAKDQNLTGLALDTQLDAIKKSLADALVTLEAKQAKL